MLVYVVFLIIYKFPFANELIPHVVPKIVLKINMSLMSRVRSLPFPFPCVQGLLCKKKKKDFPFVLSFGVLQVSEVSSLLGRAGTAGLGKAVDVLDTLGSSMTNLNLSSGFTSGMSTKGNKISILAFEVANTIVKGANLMQSLSKENIRHLKEVVLPSEGVQNLISTDMNELLRIAEADKRYINHEYFCDQLHSFVLLIWSLFSSLKLITILYCFGREELKIFSGEVVRFGNRCKDPQWHNLDRYFEK